MTSFEISYTRYYTAEKRTSAAITARRDGASFIAITDDVAAALYSSIDSFFVFLEEHGLIYDIVIKEELDHYLHNTSTSLQSVLSQEFMSHAYSDARFRINFLCCVINRRRPGIDVTKQLVAIGEGILDSEYRGSVNYILTGLSAFIDPYEEYVMTGEDLVAGVRFMDAVLNTFAQHPDACHGEIYGYTLYYLQWAWSDSAYDVILKWQNKTRVDRLDEGLASLKKLYEDAYAS